MASTGGKCEDVHSENGKELLIDLSSEYIHFPSNEVESY